MIILKPQEIITLLMSHSKKGFLRTQQICFTYDSSLPYGGLDCFGCRLII
jgi:hypothetical protein